MERWSWKIGSILGIPLYVHATFFLIFAWAALKAAPVGGLPGVTLATVFILIAEANSGTFKGFYTPWQIPLITGVAVFAMIMLTGWVALRSVLKTDPAEVFR